MQIQIVYQRHAKIKVKVLKNYGVDESLAKTESKFLETQHILPKSTFGKFFKSLTSDECAQIENQVVDFAKDSTIQTMIYEVEEQLEGIMIDLLNLKTNPGKNMTDFLRLYDSEKKMFNGIFFKKGYAPLFSGALINNSLF